MPDKNDTLTSPIPDYLRDALEMEGAMGSVDVFIDQAVQSRPKVRRIEIPQRNSTKWMGLSGKILLTSSDDETEVEEVDSLNLLLVDALIWDVNNSRDWMKSDVEILTWMQRQGNQGIGAQTMWEFDQSGRRVTTATRPTCSSDNGFNPYFTNLDKEVYDFRTGRTEKIGWRQTPEGGSRKVEYACINCPLAKWASKDELLDGKSAAPLCRQSYMYVFWDVDRREFLTLKAVNQGMHLALFGHSGATGRKYDDTPFPGVRYYFAYAGNKDGIPVFRNRPEGKPSLTNPTAPVYPVMMTVTMNNFEPATFVPQFTLLDGSVETVSLLNMRARPISEDGSITLPAGARLLSAEDYALYINAVSTRYVDEEWRDAFMWMKNIRLPLSMHIPQISAPPSVPALGAGDVDMQEEPEYIDM